MIETKLRIYGMDIPIKTDLEATELQEIRDYIEGWIQKIENKTKGKENINRLLIVLLAFLNASVECYKNKETLKEQEKRIKAILRKIEGIE